MCIYTHTRLREDKYIEEQLLYDHVTCTYTSNENGDPLCPRPIIIYNNIKKTMAHITSLLPKKSTNISDEHRGKLTLKKARQHTHFIQASPLA